MGTELVNQVVTWLQDAQIRAAEALPAQRMPRLESPAAAVNLSRLDDVAMTAELTVDVIAPRACGGGVCNQSAEAVLTVLHRRGGHCILYGASFDGRMDCFVAQVRATLPAVLENGVWKLQSQQSASGSRTPFSVSLEGVPLPFATGFSAKKTAECRSVHGLGQADPVQLVPGTGSFWQFSLEELFPPGAPEPAAPSEPFLLSLVRGTRTENYRFCRWLSITQESGKNGLRQIRTGIAAMREVVNG